MPLDILVIDDDPFVAKIVGLCLRSVSRVVVRATADGPAGLRAAASQPPDLILLDYDMPTQDGLETLRQLRAQPETQAVPVVAITGGPPDQPRCARLIAESDHYLPKPLEYQSLRGLVQGLLGPAAS